MPLSRRKFIQKSAAAATGVVLWQVSDGMAQGSTTLKYDPTVPQMVFAATEIENAAAERGHNPPSVQITIDASALGAQCYRIEHGPKGILIVTGGDANGALYGGLDVAEAIRLGTLADLKNNLHSPYIAQRGIKFNVPLDARTPSYSDAGDAAQYNVAEMWSLDFWHEFLDEMARDRYNVLSLWNLHPFPSLVKVPEYPDVALSDVMRTTAKFEGYGGTGVAMVSPTILAHLETVKKLTIDEKIVFWRAVMQHAQDRGIRVYWFTWNIFVWGAEGKHGITDRQDNPTTLDYIRKSVRETLLTYPLLAGIGLTAGENMQNLSGELANEKWLWKTYGEGICDVKKLQPNRSIRLIHRLHQTAVADVRNEWKDYPDTFDLSFKYSVAHMYSSPTPLFIKTTLDALPADQKTWLTVRNDDIYSFRWGDPDYARTFVHGMPGPEKLAGFYMGPDGYIWGREFISTEPDTPRQLVIKKQQYSFQLWGRLSYDPTLPNALFERMLTVRFPETEGKKIFQACQSASQIIPQITRFFWGGNGNDFEWFPEACIHRPGGNAGFYTVSDFMKGHTMPGSGILAIGIYAEKLLQDKTMDAITPPQVAATLQADAERTLHLIGKMPTNKVKELRLTIGDLAAMAHLGNYYAEKILGATNLALFLSTGKSEQQASAVAHLEAALEHWKKYAAQFSSQYRPQVLTRIGSVDIPVLTQSVKQDVTLAQNAYVV